jgi:hypothetical protein
MISVAYSTELHTIKEDIKDAKLIVVGNVIESIGDSHLVKINKWAKGNPKNKFIKIHAKKTLQRLQSYMFAIDDIKDDHFWVNNPNKGVYELKTMGDYKFLIRAYNSDKPLIGQIQLDSLIDYVKKDLNLIVKSRSTDKFDRKITQLSNIAKPYQRSPASDRGFKKSDSKISEVWLIITFCFLILIPILFRKTRL